MAKIDPKTRKLLDFIKNYLEVVPHGQMRDMARECKVDGATLSRLHDPDKPNYHPLLGTALRVLEKISGKFPLEIKGNVLLSNLPTRANEEISAQLAEGVADLKDKDDVALVFQFLAILKHKEILNPIHFGVLTGSMSMLQEELLRKRGPEAFLKPVEPQATTPEEKLNQEMRN